MRHLCRQVFFFIHVSHCEGYRLQSISLFAHNYIISTVVAAFKSRKVEERKCIFCGLGSEIRDRRKTTEGSK